MDGIHPSEAENIRFEFHHSFSARIPFELEFRIRICDDTYR